MPLTPPKWHLHPLGAPNVPDAPIPFLVPEYRVPASPQYTPDTPTPPDAPNTPNGPLHPLGVPKCPDAPIPLLVPEYLEFLLVPIHP